MRVRSEKAILYRLKLRVLEKILVPVEALKNEEEKKMKKLIALGIAVVMALAVSSIASADLMSTSKNVTIDLGVSGQFGFTMWDTDLAQSDTINPGDAGLFDLHMAATTNHNNVWRLQAASDGLDGLYEGDTLPVKISTFNGGGGPVGTFVDNLVLSATAQNIYTAAASEYNVTGLEIAGLLIVNTVSTTKQDLYQGNVILTMVE